MKNIIKVLLLTLAITAPLSMHAMESFEGESYLDLHSFSFESDTPHFSSHSTFGFDGHDGFGMHFDHHEKDPIETEFLEVTELFHNGQCTFEKIKEELEKSSNVQKLLEYRSEYSGKTLLHIALELLIDDQLKQQIVQLFIENGANVNAPLQNGNTPLYSALAAHAPLEIIQCLVKAGADVNAQDNDGGTPFLFALYSQVSFEVIEYLCQKGADVNAAITFQDGTQNISLSLAEEKYYGDEKVKVIKLLLQYGADPDAECIINGKKMTAKEYHTSQLHQGLSDEEKEVYETKPDQAKINAIKRNTPSNGDDASWSTPSKVGIGGVMLIASLLGGFYLYKWYKKYEAKKKIAEKKMAKQKLTEANSGQLHAKIA